VSESHNGLPTKDTRNNILLAEDPVYNIGHKETQTGHTWTKPHDRVLTETLS